MVFGCYSVWVFKFFNLKHYNTLTLKHFAQS